MAKPQPQIAPKQYRFCSWRFWQQTHWKDRGHAHILRQGEVTNKSYSRPLWSPRGRAEFPASSIPVFTYKNDARPSDLSSLARRVDRDLSRFLLRTLFNTQLQFPEWSLTRGCTRFCFPSLWWPVLAMPNQSLWTRRQVIATCEIVPNFVLKVVGEVTLWVPSHAPRTHVW
jgi:hypothetical protein